MNFCMVAIYHILPFAMYSKIVDTHRNEFSGKEIEKEMFNHHFSEMHTHTIHWLLIPHVCLKSYIYELTQVTSFEIFRPWNKVFEFNSQVIKISNKLLVQRVMKYTLLLQFLVESWKGILLSLKILWSQIWSF